MFHLTWKPSHAKFESSQNIMTIVFLWMIELVDWLHDEENILCHQFSSGIEINISKLCLKNVSHTVYVFFYTCFLWLIDGWID